MTDPRAKAMSEAELQSAVMARLKALGWLAYHTHDSRRSNPGFPDICAVHEGKGRVIFAELKSQTGRIRPEQAQWNRALIEADQDAYIWRPSDLLSGFIDRTLMR